MTCMIPRTRIASVLLAAGALLAAGCSPKASDDVAARTAGDSLPGGLTSDSGDTSRARSPHSDSGAGRAAGVTTPRPTVTDTILANLIAVVDRGQVEAGELASTKAQGATVKAYGAAMVDAHGQDLRKLTTLMRDNRIPLADSAITDAQTTPSGDLVMQAMQKQRETMQSLRGASGVSFDRAYADAMVAGHQDVLLTLEQSGGEARNDALKAHIGTVQATITEHLARAKRMQRTLMDRAARTTPQ